MTKCKCGQELLIPHEIASGLCMVCMQDAQMEDEETPQLRNASMPRPNSETTLSDYMYLIVLHVARE